MRVCIHRGSNQIGGSCVEIENYDKRLLIDFGLPLDAKGASARYLPDVSGLDGRDPDLLGVLISHPHLDHLGLLTHLSSRIPIGMGAAARRILTAASPFLPGNLPTALKGWDYQSGRSFKIGPFRVTPFLVDHSAYDAYAFLIESGGKKLFYSGDFRVHGRKAVLLNRLTANPPENIDVLMMEGSSIGRIDDARQFPDEAKIESNLMEVFSTTKGLAMVHASAQNIDRVVSILRASKRTGRRLVIDLYTAAILEATGNKNIPQSNWPEVALFVPDAQRIQIKKIACFDLLKRHSSHRIYIQHLKQALQKSTLLFRPLHCADLERGGCLAGASYIYSQWEGYWMQGLYNNVKDWLEKHAIEKHSIHTSGHAAPTDLKKFASALNPHHVVPIHTFCSDRYPDLFPNVKIYGDGEWWEV
jgi:ribonuclease J